jgi:glycine/D-amino acid oxidase-like deaminating enzyme
VNISKLPLRVIVGAGHNGLCSRLLAKSGRQVLVVEKRAVGRPAAKIFTGRGQVFGRIPAPWMPAFSAARR